MPSGCLGVWGPQPCLQTALFLALRDTGWGPHLTLCSATPEQVLVVHRPTTPTEVRMERSLATLRLSAGASLPHPSGVVRRGPKGIAEALSRIKGSCSKQAARLVQRLGKVKEMKTGKGGREGRRERRKKKRGAYL